MRNPLPLLISLIALTFNIRVNAVAVELSNGVYFGFQLATSLTIWNFYFKHPANSAQSSKTVNSFSLVFDQNLPTGSSMSLTIRRDNIQVFESLNTKPSDDNIFRFSFNEFGGDLYLTLSANQVINKTGYTCRVVFNMDPVEIKQPNFNDIGNFIYTQQTFKGTYSNFQLFKSYQINVVQPGFFLIKRYDCIGHAEIFLTRKFTTDPKGLSLTYKNLIKQPINDVVAQYDYSERIYEIKEVGTYYIMILPGYGLSLELEDAPKAFYRLEVQFLSNAPQSFEVPSSAFGNLFSLHVEENADETSFKAVFDPFEKGLSTVLGMDVSYKVVVATTSIIEGYYLRCGTDAPILKIQNGPGSNYDYEWETRERQDIESGGTVGYVIKRISTENTDLAAGAEVKLSSTDGKTSSRLFYKGVNMRKKPKDDIDVGIILVIVFGLLILLAFPVWKGIQKFTRYRKRKNRASQYEINMTNCNKDKSSFTRIMKDNSFNLDASSISYTNK